MLTTFKRNFEYYSYAKKQAQKYYAKKQYNKSIEWIQIAATIAWTNNFGVYVDLELEELIAKIGIEANIQGRKKEIKSDATSTELSILHVMTEAYLVGGHTKLVDNMMKSTFSIHSLIILNQSKDEEVPEWLKSTVESRNGHFEILDKDDNYLLKAEHLRKKVLNDFDVVVLHTHPNDPIPILAFSGGIDSLVITVNHADHVFWLGSSITNLCLEITKSGQNISKRYRGIRNSELMRIPLSENISKYSCDKKKRFREQYKIPRNATVLLCIASSYKFTPFQEFDFKGIFTEVLRQNKNTHLVIVGPSNKELYWKYIPNELKGRVHIVGMQKDIEAYYGLANVYIESFPFGSHTSCLGAMIRGIPVFPAPKPVLPELVLDEYKSVENASVSKEDYISNLLKFLNDTERLKEKGMRQKKEVTDLHCNPNWGKHIEFIIKENLKVKENQDINLGDLSGIEKRNFNENLPLIITGIQDPIIIILSKVRLKYKLSFLYLAFQTMKSRKASTQLLKKIYKIFKK
ncbi:glycosyltransferase [Psychrobacillus sp.]|uniref:glycosyltransferase n=1 Tax=Psychrobacillus sp. TaxID=1871623 RepID=UPI0028BD35E9|nr:glycosyltransferase [Psychrobacillus sp.]